MIKKKDTFYKDMKLNLCTASENRYKKARNKLVNVLKAAERNYYKNLLEVNRGNLRKVWDTLNLVIHRKKRTLRCSTFKHNDSEIDNDKTISQLFNKFFLNAPKDLYKSLPPQTEDPTSNISPNSNSLYLTPTKCR